MAKEAPRKRPSRTIASAVVVGVFGSLLLTAFMMLLINPTSLCSGLDLPKANVACPLLF